ESNVICFTHHGQQIQLLPDSKPLKARAALHVISHKQLARSVHKQEELIIATISATSASSNISDQYDHLRKQLLDTYASRVFREKLPPELPPSRSVDHAIDLIPGSTPPSRAPYRLSPIELDELKRLIQELLDSGYIQPSKS